MKYASLAAAGLVLLFTAGSAFAADAPKSGTGETSARSQYFKNIDTNGDGFISKDEWRAQGDKIFAEIDTNHDGKISPEEMKAHYDAKRAAREARHDAWKASHGGSAPAAAK